MSIQAYRVGMYFPARRALYRESVEIRIVLSVERL